MILCGLWYDAGDKTHSHDHDHDHSHSHDDSSSVGETDHGHGIPGHKCSSHLNRLLRDEEKNITQAVLLTVVSGMAAMVGGIIVVFIGTPSPFLLGHMLSFAAGIMIYISFCDLLVHAQAHLGEDGYLYANLWMFFGMAFFHVIVSVIPEPDLVDIAVQDSEEQTDLSADLGDTSKVHLSTSFQ
jgi:hypothetical protein